MSWPDGDGGGHAGFFSLLQEVKVEVDGLAVCADSGGDLEDLLGVDSGQGGFSSDDALDRNIGDLHTGILFQVFDQGGELI